MNNQKKLRCSNSYSKEIVPKFDNYYNVFELVGIVSLILLYVCMASQEITIREYYLISQVSTIVMGQIVERETSPFARTNKFLSRNNHVVSSC